MIQFLDVKSLVGSNYVRVDQVIAITTSDPTKCTVYLIGGVMVSCAEPAKDVLARLVTMIGAGPTHPATEETS